MSIDFPTNIKEAPLNMRGLIDFVLNLLEQQAIKEHPQLFSFLQGKIAALVVLDTSNAVSEIDCNFYYQAKQLLDEGKKVQTVVANKLLGNAGVAFHDPLAKNTGGLSISSNKKVEPPVQILREHRGRVNWLLNLDDNTFASSSHDHTIKLWNYKGECLCTLRGDNTGPITTLLSMQDGTLVSKSYDGCLRLWNLARGECFHTIEIKDTVSSFIETKTGKLAICLS